MAIPRGDLYDVFVVEYPDDVRLGAEVHLANGTTQYYKRYYTYIYI